ncbi:MAG: hypothetical protein LBM59_00850 [Ruminococcus sp.]|jgi:rRNA maturation endonuclease Nob1|nr:hypothetical protein [Ruminococcus sp.]
MEEKILNEEQESDVIGGVKNPLKWTCGNCGKIFGETKPDTCSGCGSDDIYRKPAGYKWI